MKPRFICAGTCSSLNDYDRALNVARASNREKWAKRQEKVYASPESGAQRKMLNTTVLILGNRDGREEVRAEQMLLMFRCAVRKKSNRDELASVMCMVHVEPLDEIYKTLKCLCPQCATSASREEEDDVGGKEGRELVATDELFQVTLFRSIASTVHIIRTNTAVDSLTTELS